MLPLKAVKVMDYFFGQIFHPLFDDTGRISLHLYDVTFLFFSCLKMYLVQVQYKLIKQGE